MKKRILDGEKNIWHGFISLSEEESHKINTPEKCIALIKSTFNSFLKDAKFNPDNIDLMCALHLDRPNHLHIHFLFWEKAPKYKGKDNALHYRRRGKIEKEAIDAMFVRLGLAISDSRKKIIALAKSLPKTGRIAYASKDMEPYRGRVDEIVRMLLDCDPKAKEADMRFYAALEERKREIENICGTPFLFFQIRIRLWTSSKRLCRNTITLSTAKASKSRRTSKQIISGDRGTSY